MAARYGCRSLLLCLVIFFCAWLSVPTAPSWGSGNTAGSVANPGLVSSTGGTGSTVGLDNTSGSSAAVGAPILRVALDEGVSSASFSVVQGSYTLIDESTGVFLGTASPGAAWSATAAGTDIMIQGPGQNSLEPYQGPIVLQAAAGNSNSAQPALFCYNGVQYRGNLAIQNLNNELLVLNVLDVESYLCGVVGEEMGGGAPLQAYCAQAVASRSYALSMRGLSPWYDVGSDTCAQAYGGYTSEQEFTSDGDNPVVDAVQMTRGQVLEYDGTMVTAYYCANAGGYTEDAENVWAMSRPYLKGVPSPGDAYAETQGEYAQGTYSWTKTISREDLGSQLGIGTVQDVQLSRDSTQVAVDPVTGQMAVNFVPDTTAVSGRVTQVTVIGTGGTVTYCRDAIRQALGLPSTLFDVDLGGQGQLDALDAQGQNVAVSGSDVTVMGSDNAPQSVPLNGLCILGSGNTLVTQNDSTDSTDEDEITFTGHGDGHGVGMSQWGAIGMAEEGNNYQDILELYYDQGKNDGNLQIADNYGE